MRILLSAIILAVAILFLFILEHFLAIKFPFTMVYGVFVTITKILIAVIFIFILSSIPAIVYVAHGP